MKDPEASTTVTRVSTPLLGGAVALAAAILIAGAMIAVPRQAVAKPEFAAQTGKPCATCHQNATGGGKLKPAGEKFKANGYK